MTVYMFAEMDVHDPEGYSEYPPKVLPLIEKHGGRITHRMGDFVAWEGDWTPSRMVIIEFPDMAAAKAFWDDPEYSPIKEIRLRTTKSRIFVGQGL